MKRIAKILALFIMIFMVLIILTPKLYAGTMDFSTYHNLYYRPAEGGYYMHINFLCWNDNMYCIQKGAYLNSSIHQLKMKIYIDGANSRIDNIMAAILCESEGRSDILGFGSENYWKQSQKALWAYWNTWASLHGIAYLRRVCRC